MCVCVCVYVCMCVCVRARACTRAHHTITKYLCTKSIYFVNRILPLKVHFSVYIKPVPAFTHQSETQNRFL